MSEQSVTAADTAAEQPTLGDLYRAWLAANGEWAAASDARKAAEAAEAEARRKAQDLEQLVGAAAVADLPEQPSGRSGWVAMGGRLYFVDESMSGSWDGERDRPAPVYRIRPQEVRKLAV